MLMARDPCNLLPHVALPSHPVSFMFLLSADVSLFLLGHTVTREDGNEYDLSSSTNSAYPNAEPYI